MPTETVLYHGTAYYCPACGERKVVAEAGDGDFYIGKDHLCQNPNCLAEFNLPHLRYLPNVKRTIDTNTLGQKLSILQYTQGEV